MLKYLSRLRKTVPPNVNDLIFVILDIQLLYDEDCTSPLLYSLFLSFYLISLHHFYFNITFPVVFVVDGIFSLLFCGVHVVSTIMSFVCAFLCDECSIKREVLHAIKQDSTHNYFPKVTCTKSGIGSCYQIVRFCVCWRLFLLHFSIPVVPLFSSYS